MIELMLLVEAQARDAGLWFNAQTAPEAYLQEALRTLHAAVEHNAGKDAEPSGFDVHNCPVHGVTVGSRTCPRCEGAAPCVYYDGCQYLTHGDCKREGKCLGGWPFSESAAPGLPSDYEIREAIAFAGAYGRSRDEAVMSGLHAAYLLAVKERDEAWAAVKDAADGVGIDCEGDTYTFEQKHAATIAAARRGR